jgi:hypothetical protein
VDRFAAKKIVKKQMKTNVKKLLTTQQQGLKQQLKTQQQVLKMERDTQWNILKIKMRQALLSRQASTGHTAQTSQDRDIPQCTHLTSIQYVHSNWLQVLKLELLIRYQNCLRRSMHSVAFGVGFFSFILTTYPE